MDVGTICAAGRRTQASSNKKRGEEAGTDVGFWVQFLGGGKAEMGRAAAGSLAGAFRNLCNASQCHCELGAFDL